MSTFFNTPEMKRIIFLITLFILLSSHDLFLKPDRFFCDPDALNTVALFNGTYYTSENIIERNRMKDVQVIGPDFSFDPSNAIWMDWDHKTLLKLETGKPGTYVAAISILPRTLELTAEEFDAYLEHDGVLDILGERQKTGSKKEMIAEKYAKHVKTVFQVGEVRTSDYQEIFNYPVELVTVNNPYEIELPGKLEVQLLSHGKPLPDQLVYLGTADEGIHHHEDAGNHHEKQFRTDPSGMINIHLEHPGEYYIRTIHMVKSMDAGIDYISNWATLTFAVK